MKTIDELLDEYAISEGFESYLDYQDSLSLSDGEWRIICARYAEHVGRQTLNDAFANAKIREEQDSGGVYLHDEFGTDYSSLSIDSDSILNTEIITP